MPPSDPGTNRPEAPQTSSPTSQPTQPLQPNDMQAPTLGTQTESPEALREARFRRYIYNSSLVICVACPVIMLLPPRRLDLSTFGLGVAFCTSAGYAMEEKTGKGLLWHVSSRLPGVRKRERERELRRQESEENEREEARKKLYRRAEEERRKAAQQEKGVLGRLWPAGGSGGEGGNAGKDWVEERAEKEREAAEEGKGFGSLIVGHVKEAFGMNDDDEDEDDDDDD